MDYYTQEALNELHKEFLTLNLPEEEFPQYVAYCYEMETAPVDPHCW